MGKKYASMQEELAARRAAEVREITAEPADLTASGHFERASGKRSGRSFARQERSRLLKKIPMQDQKIIVLLIAIVVTILVSVGAGYFHSESPEQGETSPTQTTQETWTPRSEETGIGEYSTTVDIYEYAARKTTALVDERPLYGSIYRKIQVVADRYQSGCTWYVHEGRIYLSPNCSYEDEPADLVMIWVQATNEIRGLLEAEPEEQLAETPIIVMVHDESWRMHLLLINGEVEFVAEN